MELYLKNGEWLNIPNIPIQDRAFQYGDGCFTTAKIQQNNILLWERHLQRLKRDCDKLHLQPCFHHLEQLVADLQKFSGMDSLTGTIKIIISRGQSHRGYGFSHSQKSDVYVCFYPNHAIQINYNEIHSDVLTLPISAQLMPILVGVKSLNRLEQVLLKREAKTKGVDEALVLDTNQRVIEGVSSNCFLYVGGVWQTPKLIGAGIQGVMREEILVRMRSVDIDVCETDIYKPMLSQVDALFFCNALHPMQAVHTFSGRRLDCSMTQALFNLLRLEHI
ncbi:aminodeoxychorismate lyase [Acinetobacter sp. B10A]|uniref:aminodeoxychorismate lyase n=1 Tax=Acinetobacter baretiae TaxID=2605383 RepID=UPI001B3C9797|nr:aminodeoxychorismate lyase [Acinetobacter baretiae]MBF7684596.1 aminodeoxychorismate lyase [Acinetobacter baretiae]